MLLIVVKNVSLFNPNNSISLIAFFIFDSNRGSLKFETMLTIFKIRAFSLNSSGQFFKSFENKIGNIILWLKPQFLSIFELILLALKPINFSSALLILELFISFKNSSVSLFSLIAFEIIGFAKKKKKAGIRSSSFSFLSLFFNHISTISIERVFEYKKSSKVTAYEKRFVFIFLQKDKDVANAQTNSKLVIKIKFCIFFGLFKKSNI